MQSTLSLINKLIKDYPEFNFVISDDFWWSATQNTIYINPKSPKSHAYTLHELSHALLGHKGYTRDINLLKLERDAWEHAKAVLGPSYGIKISEDTVQDNLETYRDWLYERSTCPECQTTGIEAKEQHYRCLACNHTWRVNEARLCALRRYSLQTK
mgnify:CR=1 FL=1